VEGKSWRKWYIGRNGDAKIRKSGIISINRGRLGRGAEDVSLKNQELMS